MYLSVTNVELKPGRGDQFAKLESEMVGSVRTAKAPPFYLGIWSITGNSNRVLFIKGFATYGDLENNYVETMSKPAVATVINKNAAAEGEIKVSRHNSVPEAHWAFFTKAYGEGSGTTYLFISTMEKFAEMDTFDAGGKAFGEKVGPDVIAMLNAQASAAIESSEWNTPFTVRRLLH